jgi:hypothetical protein
MRGAETRRWSGSWWRPGHGPVKRPGCWSLTSTRRAGAKLDARRLDAHVFSLGELERWASGQYRVEDLERVTS